MASLRKAQTGKRVYRGVSQSPNVGQVSARGAQGYIKRELRKKNASGPLRPVGNDGKSDRRSAVAAIALNRGGKKPYQNGGRPVLGGVKQPFNNEGRPNLNGGKKPFNNEGRPNLNQGGKKPYQNEGRPNLNGGNRTSGGSGGGLIGNKVPFKNKGRPQLGVRPGPGQGPGPRNGPRPNVPQAGINLPGGGKNQAGINLPGGGKRRPFVNEGRPNNNQGGPQQVNEVRINDAGVLELPYNEDYSQAIYQAVAEANQQLLDLNQDFNNQSLQYQRNVRDTGLQYDELQDDTLNGSAASGMLFSSMYGKGTTTNARDYANQMSDLQTSQAASKQQYLAQQAAIQNALNQQIQMGTHNLGNDLSEQAGNLGFGQNQQQLNRAQRRRRNRRRNRN